MYLIVKEVKWKRVALRMFIWAQIATFLLTGTVNSTSTLQPPTDVIVSKISNSIYDGLIQVPVNYGSSIYVSDMHVNACKCKINYWDKY